MNSQLPYRVVGKGKPVMLVHGFGEDSYVWKHQEAFLKDKYKLIIPELPGSEKSNLIDDMSMEGLADQLKLILDIECPQVSPLGGDLEGVTMIGHSMGGYITLAFAEKYPQRLAAFGLFHSSAYADNEEKKATRRKGIEFIKEHGAFAFLKTSTPNLFSPKTRDEQPELVEKHIAGLNNFSGEALVKYYEAMMARPDRTDVLRKTTVPVLFIMGKYDAAVPVEHGLEQCHLPDIAYIHILSHSGHLGMLEEPGASNLALDKFLL
jgi:pimeloyl-ACP methyl ester carboxylesterase